MQIIHLIINAAEYNLIAWLQGPAIRFVYCLCKLFWCQLAAPEIGRNNNHGTVRIVYCPFSGINTSYIIPEDILQYRALPFILSAIPIPVIDGAGMRK